MKLLNFSVWKKALNGGDGSANQGRAAFARPPDAVERSNVIPVAFGAPNFVPDQSPQPLPRAAAVNPASSAAGSLASHQMRAFFAENYFGLGRHNGAHFRTREALELGKEQLVSRFQNVLEELLMENEGRLARLKDKALETHGVCATTSDRLELACANAQRQIDALRAQLQLVSEGKGWVSEALNRYQMGFTKGLHEALAFDLIGG